MSRQITKLQIETAEKILLNAISEKSKEKAKVIGKQILEKYGKQIQKWAKEMEKVSKLTKDLFDKLESNDVTINTEPTVIERSWNKPGSTTIYSESFEKNIKSKMNIKENTICKKEKEIAENFILKLTLGTEKLEQIQKVVEQIKKN
jgi:uncharacterized protein YukE